jgi:peptidyl-prolyl cis-trans isomerase SurA
MTANLIILLLFAGIALPAVVVDRIAIVVGKRAIKTSDIDREVRITDFVNGDPLKIDAQSREEAAERLIGQELIRREIEAGGYRTAAAPDVEQFLAELKKQRFGPDTEYRRALAQYGITEETLRRHVQWQMTVLDFIEQRFRPGVVVSEDDVRDYALRHPVSDKGATPADDERRQIEDEIAGPRVTKLFEEWLEQARRQANPRRMEGATE